MQGDLGALQAFHPQTWRCRHPLQTSQKIGDPKSIPTTLPSLHPQNPAPQLAQKGQAQPCSICALGVVLSQQGRAWTLWGGKFWVEPQAQLLPLSRAPCRPVAALHVPCRPPSRAPCRPPAGNAAKESRPGEEAFIIGVTGSGTPEPVRGWGRLRRPRPRGSGAGPASARGRPC